MKPRRKQFGMSIYGILLTLTAAGFSIALVMQIVPVYVDNMSLRSALKSLEQQVGVTKMSKRKIKSILDKQLRINNARGIPLDELVVTKKKGKLLVTLDYERRVPLVQNISLLFEFKNKFEAVAH